MKIYNEKEIALSTKEHSLTVNPHLLYIMHERRFKRYKEIVYSCKILQERKLIICLIFSVQLETKVFNYS